MTNDVSFRKDGIKHKLVASGIMRYGIEGTNYWNSVTSGNRNQHTCVFEPD